MSWTTEKFIWRNGTMILNPAAFGVGWANYQKQRQAEELMEQICSVPIESQALVAEHLARENESVTPYLWYMATKTGHVTLAKAVMNSGKVGGMGDSITKYRKSRNEELFLVSAEEKSSALNGWLGEFPEESNLLMFDAAVAGDESVIKLLLENGVEPHPENAKDLTTLHAACHHGHLECAKLLVKSGVDINARDEFGGTPLMRAASGGRTGVVRWLLDNGAAGSTRCSEEEGGSNALEYGAGRDPEIVRLLLEPCGFSPTALSAAASFGNEEAFALIFDAGDFPAPDKYAEIASWNVQLSEEHRKAILGSIDQGGSGEAVNILNRLLAYLPHGKLEGNEDIVAALDNCVQRAVVHGRMHNARLILPILVDRVWTDQKSNAIDHLLFLAANSNAIDSARFLVDDYGANVNTLDWPDNTTPLYAAARAGHAEMVSLLIEEYSANIHIGSGKFANGPTPLWLTVDQRHEEVARVLLAHGGPVEFVDPKIQEGKSRRVFVVVSRAYRAPVRLLAKMDPDWNNEGCREKFMCLEYPDGWPGSVTKRRPDSELRDVRELRSEEQDGFVVV